NCRQTENELRLQAGINLPIQIVGNCCWAATEGIVKVYLLLNQLRDSSFQVTPETSVEMMNGIDTTFAKWILFQQMLLLEQYIGRVHDDKLVLQSFNFLWSAKWKRPEIFDKPFTEHLNALE